MDGAAEVDETDNTNMVSAGKDNIYYLYKASHCASCVLISMCVCVCVCVFSSIN